MPRLIQRLTAIPLSFPCLTIHLSRRKRPRRNHAQKLLRLLDVLIDVLDKPVTILFLWSALLLGQYSLPFPPARRRSAFASVSPCRPHRFHCSLLARGLTLPAVPFQHCSSPPLIHFRVVARCAIPSVLDRVPLAERGCFSSSPTVRFFLVLHSYN